ncbi:hypothetical protein HK405_012754, partial [Cladochytrium tenue]
SAAAMWSAIAIAAVALSASAASTAAASDPCVALAASNDFMNARNSTAAVVTGAQSSGSPYYSSNVDLFATLDTIAANDSITTEFDFHTQVEAAIASLNDAHSSYYPSCFLTSRLLQPFVIDAKYKAGSAPTIYIRDTVISGSSLLGGITTTAVGQLKSLLTSTWKSAITADPATYVNYTIKSINSVDAVAYIQAAADYWVGASHSPETRFNFYMPTTKWNSTTSSFTFSDGTIYRRLSVPSTLDLLWTYELESPAGDAVTLSNIPWAGYVMENKNFTGNASYYQAFCTTAGSASPQAAANGAFGASGFTTAIRANAAFAAITGFSLSAPLVSDSVSAFYILDDGVTGVWVLSAFEPTDLTNTGLSTMVGTITSGLKALESGGAELLIIDTTGNPGGFLCLGTFVVNYLMGAAWSIEYDARLSATMAALTQYASNPTVAADAALFSALQVVPVQGTSILDNTSTYTRGGSTSTYSGKFGLNCSAFDVYTASQPPLSHGWSANAILLVSDGHCGSTCAEFTRALRDAYGVRAAVTGGSSGAAFQPSAFEGGSVGSLAAIQTQALQIYSFSSAPANATATWPINPLPLAASGSLP